MAQFRIPDKYETPWAQVPNQLLEDERLSWKAKGLMSFLLSKSEDWDVYQAQLEEVGPDGESATRSGLRELREHGYLERNRLKDNEGKFAGYEYIISPFGDTGAETGFSSIGSSSTGESRPTNKESTNKESTNTTDPNGSGGKPPDSEDEEALTTTTEPPTKHVQPPGEDAIRKYVSEPDNLGDQNYRAAVIFSDLFDPGGEPSDHISRLIREANRMLGGQTPEGRPIDKPESRVQVALAASLLYKERPDLRDRDDPKAREDQPHAALNVISRKISEELEDDSPSGIEVDEDHPFADIHKKKMSNDH